MCILANRNIIDEWTNAYVKGLYRVNMMREAHVTQLKYGDRCYLEGASFIVVTDHVSNLHSFKRSLHCCETSNKVV